MLTEKRSLATVFSCNGHSESTTRREFIKQNCVDEWDHGESEQISFSQPADKDRTSAIV